MNTRVIILAQGTQKRMIGVKQAKQLLALPAHAACHAPNAQIMGRTIMQVVKLLTGDAKDVVGAHHRWNDQQLTVVGWPATEFGLEPVRVPCHEHELTCYPRFVHLDNPGNSSLLGIHRYLQLEQDVSLSTPPGVPIVITKMKQTDAYPRTVVLLGDVVYSWKCLETLLRPPVAHNVTFAGTSDLGPGGGEIWGASWYREADHLMTSALRTALGASSKADPSVYQPGQLRHWLWTLDRLLCDGGLGSLGKPRAWYVPVDDYTMDVDLIEHLVDLARASLEAYAEDKSRGMVRCG